MPSCTDATLSLTEWDSLPVVSKNTNEFKTCVPRAFRMKGV